MSPPIPIIRGLAWHGVPFKGTKAQYNQALRIFAWVFPLYTFLDLAAFVIQFRLDFLIVGLLAILTWKELGFVVKTGRYYRQGIGQFPMDILAFYLIGFSYVSLIFFALTPLFFYLSVLHIVMANSVWLLRGLMGSPRPEILREHRRFYRGRTSKKYQVYVLLVGLFSFQTISVVLNERCTVEGTNCQPVNASLTVKIVYLTIEAILVAIAVGWPKIARKLKDTR